jgi:hypothetical protein
VKKQAHDPASLSLHGPEAISARLEEMERKIERLRAMYETFFSGVERQPPNAPRRELNRLMLEMQQLQIRNAALRFRFQSLSQRWTLFTTYWNRTLREIESGTYRKDLAKVSRRLASKGMPLSEQEAIALGIPASRARALVARQGPRAAAGAPAATAPAPDAPEGLPDALAGPAENRADAAGAGLRPAAAAARPPGPPSPPARPPGIPGVSEDELAALHRRYAEAARQTGQPGPSLARLREQLTRHVPQVIAQLGTDQVTFDVAVKDGRVVLRPKPRKT